MKRRMKILLVDDDADDRTLGRRALTAEFPEAEFLEAADAKALGAAISTFRPDLVVTDFALRWTTGLGVLRSLKQSLSGVVVIMFTGTGDEETAAAAMRHGLDEYVVKSAKHVIRLAAAARRAMDRVAMRRDLAESERRLVHSQRLESTGRLAGGVAHDFNNLLTVVLGGLEVLVLDPTLGPEGRRYASDARDAAVRAAGLSRRLLALSKSRPSVESVVDLNDVVREAAGLLARLLGEEVRFDVRRHPSPLPVLADPAQLEQVLLNLAVNARDAMPDGGVVVLATSLEEAGTSGAEWATLTVADSGTGMTKEIREQIFEPFFTTKAAGVGTGLGLATVDGIVTRAGGTVSVESAPGDGSTFTIRLPLAAALPAARIVAGPARDPNARKGKILLAEDDASVRDVFVRHLISAGHEVDAAADGHGAFAKAADVRKRYDALITDVVMPGRSGLEVARAFKNVRPHAPVLFISGFAENTEAEVALAVPDAGWLTKPFDRPTFLAAVDAALPDGPVRSHEAD